MNSTFAHDREDILWFAEFLLVLLYLLYLFRLWFTLTLSL